MAEISSPERVAASAFLTPLRVRHFAHQLNRVSVGIVEDGQPEIVVGHPGNKLRLLHNLSPTIAQCSAGLVDICHAEI